MGSKHSQFGCVSAPVDIGELSSPSASRSLPLKASSVQQLQSSSSSQLHSLSCPSVTSRSISSELLPRVLEFKDAEEEKYITDNTESTASLASTPTSFLSELSELHSEEVLPQYRPSMKLLFLDVDGVLNRPSTPWDAYHTGLDSKLLKYLKLIVLTTGCKIVLSTTWRLNVNAKRILLSAFKTRMDMDPAAVVLGQTKSLKIHGLHRTNEIEHFLTANRHRINVVSWCALDDLALDRYDAHSERFMRGHFVRTDRKTGLSPRDALSAIDILNAAELKRP